MNKRVLKYIAAAGATLLFLGSVFASPMRSSGRDSAISPLFVSLLDTLPADPAKYRQPEYPSSSEIPFSTEERVDYLPGRGEFERNVIQPDRQNEQELTNIDNLLQMPAEAGDAEKGDTTRYASDSTKSNNFLDMPIRGKNRDSLVYKVKDKTVYIYNEGDVVYGSMNMKADFMRVQMDTKELYAYGISDTLGNKTRPVFTDKGENYTMDTITYNIGTGKAKIKGVASQQGEGFLLGDNVKKMHDNTIHIKNGKYTTCDDPDCPHFYLALTKGKVIPNKKVVVSYSYLVLEDVPIYFPGIPEGFFPITQERSSGILMPSFGEETVKGFFIRDGGYYWAISDHMDLTLLGGFYTLGSWEASAASRYTKRYAYNGNFSLRFSNDIVGEKGDAAYVDQNNFKVSWTHTQDPKFRPNSSFSASVNLSTSGYSKNSATTLQEHLNTQTNSTIAFSKSWPGTPFSFSTNLSHSQNSRDTTHSIGFPNATLNMSRIYPFKRKNAVGKQRWYEKISMSYTGSLSNSVTAKEYDLFKEDMFKNMKTGVQHSIPVSTSFNILNYINVSPSANYTERWFFKKVEKEWDPVLKQQVNSDTTFGFYRVYEYNASMSASTKVYGTYQFKSKTSKLQAVRHTLTPTIGVSYRPDFGNLKHGFYKNIQADSTGRITTYSPYANNAYGVPGAGASASMNFSLSQTLEAKVLSKSDTSGVKKVKIIDNFSFSGSYNFLAKEFNLSNIALNLRMTIPFLKNFGLNISATLDPYEWAANENGTYARVNRILWGKGKIGHIVSTGWSAGYSFNGGKQTNGQPAVNNINSQVGFNDYNVNPFEFDPDNPMNAADRRALMTGTYYDFSIPWNFGFSYSVNYRNNLHKKTISQTLSFNASVNLTSNWGISFNGGFDFENGKLTPGVFTLTRDLHCWQFNFNWVPIGSQRSWSFNISVKSALLRDLKYDKRNSRYDNLYDDL